MSAERSAQAGNAAQAMVREIEASLHIVPIHRLRAQSQIDGRDAMLAAVQQRLAILGAATDEQLARNRELQRLKCETADLLCAMEEQQTRAFRSLQAAEARLAHVESRLAACRCLLSHVSHAAGA